MTATLTLCEKLVLESLARNVLPDQAGYVWSKALEMGKDRAGRNPVHAGNAWWAKVVAAAAEILEAAGIPTEVYAGSRYVGGRRVWQDHGGEWRTGGIKE